VENQVRFNQLRSDNNHSCNQWFFLIINRDYREISRIENSINNLFAPIIEEYKSYEGKLYNPMKYKLLNFDSEKLLDSSWKSKIFCRIFRDNNLYLREKNADGLEKYISEIDKKIKI
jgi:hypothetical protein